MAAFASLNDVSLLMSLTTEQQETAKTLLEWVSDRLRFEAEKVGHNLDDDIDNNPYLETVAKSITAGIVERTLKANGSDMTALMTQYSQSAGGYSVSGTVANPGESLYIKRSELKALGLTRQRIGVVDFYGVD